MPTEAWIYKAGTLYRSEMEPQAIEKKVADPQPSNLELIQSQVSRNQRGTSKHFKSW